MIKNNRHPVKHKKQLPPSLLTTKTFYKTQQDAKRLTKIKDFITLEEIFMCLRNKQANHEMMAIMAVEKCSKNVYAN